MKVLLDTDYFYALSIPSDSNHEKAAYLHKMIALNNDSFVLSLVIQEAATVFSNKVSQEMAILFYHQLQNTSVTKIDLSLEMESLAWKIFFSQTKKGTSFIDCANMATIQYYKLDGILSFDTFYPSSLRRGI